MEEDADMDITKGFLMTILMGLVLIITPVVQAVPEGGGDTTLSPYFWVQSDDPEIDQLPLKSTDVTVDISGVIADVVVTQVYLNTGQAPLEAIYVFPASTKAAVYGMKMTIGERTIIAEIKERKQARQDYENAKKAGRSASLLEQHRPNVFQMNVANILPGDVVIVELKYTELLVPTDAVYEFAYPTVVGPRYMGGQDEDAPRSDQWAANPYLQQGKLPKSTFNITVSLNAGLVIGDITCGTHDVDISYKGKNTANIGLEPLDKYGGKRDFLLKYRLTGKRIQSGLLLSEGDDENFFLMMLQPPKRVKTDQIPPREYVFIVDISGSMHGFPLDISKKLLRNLIGNLRTTDRFNVLLFAGSAMMLSSQSLPATQENIKQAIDVIDNQRGGGGTQLLPALKKALAMEGTQGFSRTIVMVTDGYVTVEEEAFDVIRNRLGDANMFAFGIGSSVNRHLIEGIARVGMGEPFVITKPAEAPEKAEKFRKLIESPVLTNIRVDYGDFDVYDVEPPSIPDVLADRPVIVLGKWRGNPKGTIRISGLSGEGPFTHKIKVKNIESDQTNTALRYLWARHRIAVLADYNKLRQNDDRIKTVTQLGLTYNLLTEYTSFVAVDTRIRLKNGKPVTVRQPLPLPQGVSNYAVGGKGYAMRSQMAPSTASGMSNRQLVHKEALCTDEKVDGTVEQEVKKKMALIKDLEVTKNMTEENIRKVLQNKIPEIEACRGTSPGLLKIVRIVLQVDAKGRVVRVEFDKNTAKNRSLVKCLKNFFKKMLFPPHENGRQGKITFALTG
jgi:Ca-activated chloride channel homolog